MYIELIKETTDTPALLFDKSNNKLIMKGKSIAEDPRAFYTETSEKIRNLASKTDNIDMVAFCLSYFNTLSAKYIFDLMKTIQTTIPNVTIEWQYEQDDEDMLESGEDFEDMLSADFVFTSL
ncbi:MAG: DUF1987 domain-containing protein [Bacteroidota bacterium]|nr:DUF1987 domain-containing protein [Bacteroidota bacterium]